MILNTKRILRWLSTKVLKITIETMSRRKGLSELRIGVVYSHFSERGGAENVILKQLELLRNNGYDARCYFAYVKEELLKPSSNPHCYINDYFARLLPNFKTARIILSLPLAPLTYKNLRNLDVLICHGYGPGPWIGYVQKKLRQTKYVSYIHFLPRMFYLEPEERRLWSFDVTRKIAYSLGRLSEALVKKLDFLGISNSDCVLVNSMFTERRVKKVYGLDSIVCYPPVDTEIFRNLGKKVDNVLKLKLNRPLIVSSGRLVAIKRWDLLIKAMPYIKRDFPSATLAITGEMPRESMKYLKKLMTLAKELDVADNVKFLGFRTLEELVELYNRADVYAYPTPKEDFGLGPVEAMACGTPAVVWDDDAGPCETVIDGETGFRAEPYNVKDFGEKILKAIEMDKYTIGDSLHNYVEDNFSCQRHIEVLRNVLEKI